MLMEESICWSFSIGMFQLTNVCLLHNKSPKTWWLKTTIYSHDFVGLDDSLRTAFQQQEGGGAGILDPLQHHYHILLGLAKESQGELIFKRTGNRFHVLMGVAAVAILHLAQVVRVGIFAQRVGF